MDQFHKLQEIIDRNTDVIPENDYIEFCSTLMNIRNLVQPPGFMVDQNTPMPMPVQSTSPSLIPPFMPTYMYRPARVRYLANRGESSTEEISSSSDEEEYETETETESGSSVTE